MEPMVRVRIAIVLVTGAIAWWDSGPARAGETSDASLQRARAAIKELGEGLKGQLAEAIKAGGPQSAIAVCRTAAPQLAADASEKHGLSVRRTALKVRNPDNAPDAWERKVLEDFLKRAAAGEDMAKLEHSEPVTENGLQIIRYMKAIPMTAEPCSTCHGTAIEPGLKAQIEQLYPADQATGFNPGEVRGAFTVRITGE